MLFSSLIFLYMFFPINIILYFISKNNTYRNIILLCFSMFFYAWGEPFFIFLMIISAFINYIFAIYINKSKKTIKSKALLVVSIIINLFILAFFKYFNFFISNINFVLRANIDFINVGLPIGISFYTFQNISYIVDVYRREVEPQTKFYKLLMYISLYPQLMAGPIVRYKDVAFEIDNRITTLDKISYGINRFAIGLLKKVLIANTAGKVATSFLNSNFSELSILGAWFGIIMYTLQIYFDFSGYSDMAIGLGKMFGFTYKENFNYPYIAKSVQDFWRRWHISLSSFFRDYVYIPLGGNRKNFIRNVIIVWMLTGFWHGASYNFIVWGLFYGVLLLFERLLIGKLLMKLPSIVSHVYLIIIVMVGWVFFYYIDILQAVDFIKILFGFTHNPISNLKFEVEFFNYIIFMIFAILMSTPIFKNINNYIKSKNNSFDELFSAVFNGIILIVITIMLVGQTYNPFLYFRF